MSEHTNDPTEDEDDVEGHLRMTTEQLHTGTTPKQAMAEAAEKGTDDVGPILPSSDQT